jgi:PDZ domain-containing secreted protein/Zn-dependent protease
MESSFKILRVRGIEIGANWSYLLVFGLVTTSLATSFFPAAYDGMSPATYWLMALVTTIAFIACLLLHELGHAFRALKEGMEIEGITLWLLGGVAKFKGMFPSAGAEFRIAIAGPAVTVVLIVVFGLMRAGANSIGAPDYVNGIVDYLFQINLTLLIFNMLPALPLDGGRVLRSTLWAAKRSYLEATISAARIARVFAWMIIAVGVMFLLAGAYNGLLLALVGYFILQAGQAEVAFAMFRSSLRGQTVRDLMTQARVAESDLPIVDPDDDIGRALVAMQEGPGRAAVVDGTGQVVGLISTADVALAIERDRIESQRSQRGSGRLVTAILVIAGIFAIGYFVTPPFVTFAPGTAFDVTDDITIDGLREDRVRGEYLLTSVAVQQPNLFGLAAAFASGKDISPLTAVVPQDVDPEEYFAQQEAVFKEAQETAAAAAAKAAGMDVTITGKGAKIQSVVKKSPAEGRLKAGDVITSIDGHPVRLADDLSKVIRARPPQTSFSLEVLRGKEPITVSVESRAGVIPGAPGIGVNVTTEDYKVDLPFKISFKKQEIGGPSAGLTYALAVYDLISRSDLAKGRTVATTGTMDIDGNVGPIGGVEQKTVAAKGAGAEILLVPEEEVSQVPRLDDLDVIGVSTLMEAIRALRS